MKNIQARPYKKYRQGYPQDTLARICHVNAVVEGKEDATILETPVFQYFTPGPPIPPYVVVPKMIETHTVISGPTMFGNTITSKGYKIAGKIGVETNFTIWYLGTISANVYLNGDVPWKVTGVVEAFDDITGNWLQTGLADGARFSDSAGGTVNAEYCTIMEDYNSEPGSIILWLAVASSTAAGDIYGNVAFEYDILIDKDVNLTFVNEFYP